MERKVEKKDVPFNGHFRIRYNMTPLEEISWKFESINFYILKLTKKKEKKIMDPLLLLT